MKNDVDHFRPGTEFALKQSRSTLMRKSVAVAVPKSMLHTTKAAADTRGLLDDVLVVGWWGGRKLDATTASYAPLNLNEELMRTLFLVAFRLQRHPS